MRVGQSERELALAINRRTINEDLLSRVTWSPFSVLMIPMAGLSRLNLRVSVSNEHEIEPSVESEEDHGSKDQTAIKMREHG